MLLFSLASVLSLSWFLSFLFVFRSLISSTHALTPRLLAMPPVHHAAPVTLSPANCTHPPNPLRAHPASDPLVHTCLIVTLQEVKGQMKWRGFICHIGGWAWFPPLRVSWLCLLLFLLSQPTWKPLPLFVHSSTEGKLISTVWGQTDKRAQTQPDDAIGQAPRCPSANPFPRPPLLFPASLSPAYGNKLSLSQSMKGRGSGLYLFPSLISLPPSSPASALCCLTGRQPRRAAGEASAQSRAKPNQNKTDSVPSEYSKSTWWTFSLRKMYLLLVFHACTFLLYIAGDYISSPKEPDFPEVSVLSITVTM